MLGAVTIAAWIIEMIRAWRPLFRLGRIAHGPETPPR